MAGPPPITTEEQRTARQKREDDERRKFAEESDKQKRQVLMDVITALARCPMSALGENDESAERANVLRSAAAYYGMLKTVQRIEPDADTGNDTGDEFGRT